MDQARYWMWAKRKQPDSNPHIVVPSSPAVNPYGDSWEEQAFAEDAAGSLGGYVWPPRSYSCSFCRREFRSAQALGGHMNVHRRDRARMKQLSPSEVVPQIHALNPCTSLHHSQMSTLLYNNPNPNPEFSDSSCFVRVSSPPKKVINNEEVITTSTLSFFSPVGQKKDVGNNIVSSQAPSWSSFVAEKRNRAFDLMKKSAIVEPDSRAEKQDCVTEDLSINLNLDFCGSITKKSSDDEVASCKRRRIEASPLSTLPKLSAFKLCSGSVEELDLELRLGDAPKVK